MPLDFIYKHALVPGKEIRKNFSLMEYIRVQVKKLIHEKSYVEPLSFVQLPFDVAYQEKILQLAYEKQKLEPSLVILIGIGGSNLGALAVHQVLQGVYYNDFDRKPKFFCADTVDKENNQALAVLVEQELKKGEKVLFVIISKSGTTMETTMNADFFIKIIKKYDPQNYHEQIMVITDKDSPLRQQAQEKNYDLIEIPHQVGGRFSVFSAVGLFPLVMLRIDIKQFIAGAQQALEDDYSAARRAAILFYHYKNNFFVHDLFFFQSSYQAVGVWYRQLMAESLGKQGKGMLPTVTMAVDLHSQIQLYFGGPRYRITTFFEITHQSLFQQQLAQAVQTTYKKQKLPFMTFSLENDSFSVGYLLQSMMLEIVYLGYLMQIPVFNQPEVEFYKQEMRVLG